MIEIKSKNPKKELDMFFWASIITFGISALALPFMAVATIPLAGRAALLTFHKDIKGEYYIPRTRAVLFVVFAGAIWWLFAN